MNCVVVSIDGDVISDPVCIDAFVDVEGEAILDDEVDPSNDVTAENIYSKKLLNKIFITKLYLNEITIII